MEKLRYKQSGAGIGHIIDMIRRVPADLLGSNKIILFVIVVCYSLTSYCQNEYSIEMDESFYNVGNNEYCCSVVCIKNTSDSDIWMWFEKDSLLDVKTTIRHYLYKIHHDASLFGIVTDPNTDITEWNSELYSTFLKRIKPKEKFEIYSVSNSPNSYIDNLRIYSNDTIEKHAPGFTSIPTLLDIICYPKDFIVLEGVSL